MPETKLQTALAKLDAFEAHMALPQGGLMSTTSHWLQFAEAAAAFVRAERSTLEKATVSQAKLIAISELLADVKCSCDCQIGSCFACRIADVLEKEES